MKYGALLMAGVAGSRRASLLAGGDEPNRRFEISLHPYSLKPLFDSGELNPLSYPLFARDRLGLRNIEFAAEFCGEMKENLDKADEVRRAAEAVGVNILAFLAGTDTALDAAEAQDRAEALRVHLQWAKVAERLGCEFMRVRASTENQPDAQLDRAADGIGKFCQAMQSSPVAILIENIAGHSKDPAWLLRLVQRIGDQRVGVLADFGNFDGDFYEGMRKLLPRTKLICSKSWDFDAAGNETKIDYARMMRLIKDSGYRGCISIEYLGQQTPPPEGIRKTAQLIEKYS